MLPNCVVIGAMKCGTTSFASYLSLHPDAFVSLPKEPNFFSTKWKEAEAHGRLGELRDWYESLFSESGEAIIRCEASISYASAPRIPAVPARIARLIPDARLIYLVRDPVERIRSMWNHLRGVRKEPCDSIIDAVQQNPDYLDITRYAYQLERYLEYFPRSQILVVSSERLATEPNAVMTEAYSFLGIDASFATSASFDQRLNEAAVKGRRYPATLLRVRNSLERSGVLDLLSPRVRRGSRHVLTRRVAAPSEEARSQLEELVWSELKADVEHLREIVGPNFPLWTGPGRLESS